MARVALVVIGGVLAVLFLPWPWWLVTVAVLAVIDAADVLIWLGMRRRRPLTGPESLVGERGRLAGPGRVRIRGTSYPARLAEEEGAPAGGEGEAVEVVGVDGLTLLVRRVSGDA